MPILMEFSAGRFKMSLFKGRSLCPCPSPSKVSDVLHTVKITEIVPGRWFYDTMSVVLPLLPPDALELIQRVLKLKLGTISDGSNVWVSMPCWMASCVFEFLSAPSSAAFEQVSR